MDNSGAENILKLIRLVADSEALPRFRNMESDAIRYKSCGEVVTQTDVAIQTGLIIHLKTIYPHAVFVAEEHCADISHDFAHASDADHTWIIDPVDGTGNFVRGDPFFCTMVALQERGATVAAWLYAPVLGLSGYAVVDEPPIFSGPLCGPVTEISSPADIVTTHPLFWSESDRRLFEQAYKLPAPFRPSRCAGIEYLALAAGRSRGLVFTWDKPWDHIPGLFLLAASGGAHRCADGKLYTSRGGNHMPLIAARSSSEISAISELLASSR